MLEWVYFAHRCFHLVIILVGSDALQDLVVIVSEEDVPLRVQLQDEVVGVCFSAESEDNDSLHSDLPHALQSFGAQILPELHGEARGYLLLVCFLVDCVEADAIFDEHKRFLL